MRRLTQSYLDTLGIRIPNVDSTVALLSGGQRQCIAVARSIYSIPTVLIMDEPLAALGVRESALVLGSDPESAPAAQRLDHPDRAQLRPGLRGLRSHQLPHSGEIVLDASTAETSEEELIRIVKSGLGRQAIAAAASEVGDSALR